MAKQKRASLAELMFNKVQSMNKAEIRAFREVLTSTLPTYIDEAAKQAVDITKTTERDKHDNKA